MSESRSNFDAEKNNIMKYRQVIYFWLSFVSLIISLVLCAGGNIGAGVITLLLGLIASFIHQSAYVNQA